MRTLVGSCLALAACGRIGFDDAYPTGPFTSVELVTELDSVDDTDDCTLTDDQLDIC